MDRHWFSAIIDASLVVRHCDGSLQQILIRIVQCFYRTLRVQLQIQLPPTPRSVSLSCFLLLLRTLPLAYAPFSCMLLQETFDDTRTWRKPFSLSRRPTRRASVCAMLHAWSRCSDSCRTCCVPISVTQSGFRRGACSNAKADP